MERTARVCAVRRPRSARQGVILKLPGADDATLHLQFAEAEPCGCETTDNPAQSLADASTELEAAFTVLSADPSSPLWPRYRLDAATLLSEEFGTESRALRPCPTGTPQPDR